MNHLAPGDWVVQAGEKEKMRVVSLDDAYALCEFYVGDDRMRGNFPLVSLTRVEGESASPSPQREERSRPVGYTYERRRAPDTSFSWSRPGNPGRP
jgi:hypothetical protein